MIPIPIVFRHIGGSSQQITVSKPRYCTSHRGPAGFCFFADPILPVRSQDKGSYPLIPKHVSSASPGDCLVISISVPQFATPIDPFVYLARTLIVKPYGADHSIEVNVRFDTPELGDLNDNPATSTATYVGRPCEFFSSQACGRLQL